MSAIRLEIPKPVLLSSTSKRPEVVFPNPSTNMRSKKSSHGFLHVFQTLTLARARLVASVKSKHFLVDDGHA